MKKKLKDITDVILPLLATMCAAWCAGLFLREGNLLVGFIWLLVGIVLIAGAAYNKGCDDTAAVINDGLEEMEEILERMDRGDGSFTIQARMEKGAVCPECGGRVFTVVGGRARCAVCGAVQERKEPDGEEAGNPS